MVETGNEQFFSEWDSKQYLSLTLELYPTEEQGRLIRRTIGCCRFYHNLVLEDSKWEEATNGRNLFKVPSPASYKSEYEFLKEVDSSALANQQLIVRQTFKNHRKNPRHFGRPKYKSRRDRVQSYRTSFTNNNIRLGHNYLQLPKIGQIKTHRYLTIDGTLKSATIKLEPTGRYIAVLLYDVGARPKPQYQTDIDFLLTSQKVVGLDLGLGDIVVDSYGKKWGNPRLSKRYESEISKLNRQLSHKYNAYKAIYHHTGKKLSECKNYQKIRRKLARLHERIANRRKDYINKIVNYYISNYDVILVETLDIQSMQTNRQMSKAIGDVSWRMIVERLKLKALQIGKVVIAIGQGYPSSQECNVCRCLNPDVRNLSVREWECIHCGAQHDRDINASLNIQRQGLRIYQELLKSKI